VAGRATGRFAESVGVRSASEQKNWRLLKGPIDGSTANTGARMGWLLT
jgi:hypothetical protein